MNINWKEIFENRYKSKRNKYEMAGYGSEESFYERKRRIKKIVDKYYKNGLCVDLGCGSGLFSDLFTKYIGIDFSISAIHMLKRKKFSVVSNILNIPLKNSVAKFVLLIEVIQYIEDIDSLFREVARITEKEGFIVVVSQNPQSIYWVARQMKGKTLLKLHKIDTIIESLKPIRIVEVDGIFLPPLKNQKLSNYSTIL